MKYFKESAKIIALMCAGLIVSGCGESKEAGRAVTPPRTVNVAEVVYKKVDTWNDFTGRLSAFKSVEIKSNVSGFVTDVLFTEGGIVKKGDLLFKIDSRPFQVEVDRLNANLRQAMVTSGQAERENKRADHLVKMNVISEEEAESRFAFAARSKAEVSSIKASLRSAKLNLEFTNVKSPISGRVSNILIHVGNLVTKEHSLLTTVVSVGKIHVMFSISENMYYKYFSSRVPNAVSEVQKENQNIVYLKIGNEKKYSRQGHVDFIDNQVNPRTGTIRVRAIFENSDGLLIPGLFARLRLMANDFEDVPLVADRAIGTDLENRYVLVVNSDGKTEYRRVKLGKRIGDLRVITSGLSEKDQVVVDGLQKVRPGSFITPNIIPMSKQSGLDESFMQEISKLVKEDNIAIMEKP